MMIVKWWEKIFGQKILTTQTPVSFSHRQHYNSWDQFTHLLFWFEDDKRDFAMVLAREHISLRFKELESGAGSFQQGGSLVRAEGEIYRKNFGQLCSSVPGNNLSPLDRVKVLAKMPTLSSKTREQSLVLFPARSSFWKMILFKFRVFRCFFRSISTRGPAVRCTAAALVVS